MTLAINHKKRGAPYGMEHGRATVPFSMVEAARDLHDGGMKPKQICKVIEQKMGRKLSLNTLSDWLYLKTRVYG